VKMGRYFKGVKCNFPKIIFHIRCICLPKHNLKKKNVTDNTFER
jgi:hypothetical protein